MIDIPFFCRWCRLVAAVVLLASLYSPLFAQTPESNTISPFSIGVYAGAGMAYNISPNMLGSAQDPNCPLFSSINKLNAVGGISASYILDNDEDPFAAVLTRIMYSTIAADFVQPGDVVPLRVNHGSEGDSAVPGWPEHRFHTSFSILTVDIASNLMPFSGSQIGIVAGVSLGFPVATSYDYTFALTAPAFGEFIRDPASPYRYSDDNRTIYVEEGKTVQNLQSVYASLITGVQYPFTFTTIDLVPSVVYRHSLTELSDIERWTFLQVQAGVDIRLRL